jgi:hypothetical protein
MTPDISIKIGDEYGGWRVEKLVDRTCLSEVWKVRHVLTGTEAALKVIAEDLIQDQFFLDKFASEVKILQTLQHPNILAGLGCFPVGSRYGVTTPWVDGWTLEKLISANRGNLPLEDSLAIAISMLETLAVVHAHHIYHRDIKPNNILIEASTLKPYLIDFGIALVVGEPRKTRYGMVLGNPKYMSPEQIQRFHEVDHRSDIYAMGCVLFEMLTGRPPFDSDAPGDTEKLLQVQRMQIADPPPLLRDIRPDLPVKLEAVVAMALAKNPDERYVSCLEFAGFLRAVQEETAADKSPAITSKSKAQGVDQQKELFALLNPGPRLQTASHILASLALPGTLAVMIVEVMFRQASFASAWIRMWPAVACAATISAFSYFTVVYRSWSALPKEETRTSGAKAVLLHFLLPYTLVAMVRYLPGSIFAFNRHATSATLDLRTHSRSLGIAWLTFPLAVAATSAVGFESMERAIAMLCLVACWAAVHVALLWRVCDAVNQLADLHEHPGAPVVMASQTAEARD